MKFETVSGAWLVEKVETNPEDMLDAFINGAIEFMPQDSLGHIKGFAEFDGGRIFVSSTLIPPDINITPQGIYSGGPVTLHIALIFGDVDLQTLSSAVANGETRLGALIERKLIKL